MKIISFIFVFFLSGFLPALPIFAQVRSVLNPTQEKDSAQPEQKEELSRHEREIIANDFLEQAFKQTRDTEKIQLYKKALEITPDNPDIYNSLGVIYKKLKMYNMAFSSYKKALSIPSYQTPEYTHNNIGVLLKEMERYDEAIEEFKKAITIKPYFAKSWNNLGTAYKSKGMFDEAIECFNKALKLKPDFLQAAENIKNIWKLPRGKSPERKRIESIYNEALNLYQTGKIKEAILGFQQVQKLDSGFGNVHDDLELARNALALSVHIQKADQMVRAGSISSANEELQQAEKFATNDELKARLEQKLDRLNKKGELIAKENQLMSLYREGIAQLQQQRWLKAISLFTKVILIDPGYRDVQMYNRRARVNFYMAEANEKTEQMQWDEAKKAYLTLLNIDPENEEALKALEQLPEKKDKVTIDFYLLQAEEALNFQDIETARKSFRLVLEIDPENHVATEGLARITVKKQARTSKMEEASLDKQKLIKLGGIAAVALLILAVLLRVLKPKKVLEHYRKLKDFDKTRIVYERVIDTDPRRREVYPPLASLYYQLKLRKKLPTLLDYCRRQLENADPGVAPLWQLCLGEIYLENKEFDKASQQIEKAYKMAPELGEITEKLIETYNYLAQDDPENSTYQERIKQLRADGSRLPMVRKTHDKNIANMDDEAKRALLKECFGQKKGNNLNSKKEDKKNTETKFHPATS